MSLCGYAEDGYDWLETTPDYENIEKLLKFVSEYEIPDVTIIHGPYIVLKDTTTGKIEEDFTIAYNLTCFDIVQDYLKNTYSENWELQLQPKDFEECVVHFVIPEKYGDLADILDIPDQYVKKLGKVEEPEIDINDILKSKDIQEILEEGDYKREGLSFDWTFEGTWYTLDFDSYNVRVPELNLELNIYDGDGHWVW